MTTLDLEPAYFSTFPTQQDKLSYLIQIAAAPNMDEPRGYYPKWHKSEKANTMWLHLHVESKKWNKTNRLINMDNKLVVAIRKVG